LGNCDGRQELTRSWLPPPRGKGRRVPADEPPKARVTTFDPSFREDLRYWVASDPKTALRLLDLVEAATRDPSSGIGKPEPLKYLGARVGSRRLTEEHRLVYRVTGDRIDFLQGRYHY
jgi:toxin YoeB